MLDLNPGIHFHEIHFVIGQQELDGTGIFVANGLRRLDREIADVGALFRGQLRAGRDLDQLLVAALDRAVALEQVHGVAEAVGENLRFDVLRIDDALLEEDFRAAEGLGGFGDHSRISRFQLFAVVATTDTATTTTGCCLEHDRVADALCFAQGLGQIRQIAFGTGGDRYAGGDHAAAGFGLVAHAGNDFSRRANELDAALGADLRQFGVLGQKTVARVQCVTAGFYRQVNQLARVQITGQRVAADVVGLVGTFDVQGIAVGIGIDRNRGDAHLRASADDANGNLAPVGNQNFLDHVRVPRGGDRVDAVNILRVALGSVAASLTRWLQPVKLAIQKRAAATDPGLRGPGQHIAKCVLHTLRGPPVFCEMNNTWLIYK